MEIKKDIENLPYLSKTALSNYLDKNPDTLRNSISYWVKNKSLIRLKRGFLCLKIFWKKEIIHCIIPDFCQLK